MFNTLPPTLRGHNYGITERKPLPIVDLIFSYELGDLSEPESAKMFKELEARGEHKLIKKLRSEHV